MKIRAEIKGDMRQHLGRLGPLILDASNRAVERQGGETQQKMRTEITQGLSARAANAYRRKKIVNPNQQVVSFLYSGWRKRSRSGGRDVDMFQAYEQGAIVRPVRGKYLAIPLPQAYSVVGAKGGRGERPTPRSVEAALNAKLKPVFRPGHLPLLMAHGISVGGGMREGSASKRGSIARLRAATFTSKGRQRRRRNLSGNIPMFVLLRNMRLPRRLDFSRIEEDGAKALDDKFIVEMAGRGVFT